MKIGIRAHDIGKFSTADLGVRIVDSQINIIQLVLNKALLDYEMPLDQEKAKTIAISLSKSDVEIAMLGAYFNPIHSDQAKLHRGIENFKNHLKYAQIFGTKYVGTETGSYNDDQWTFNPLNKSEKAYQGVLKVFKQLTDFSESTTSYVAIEGAYNHVISTPEKLLQLINDLKSERVKIIVDIYNFLSIDNHFNHVKIFDQCLELFSDKIVIFHLKDYIVKDNKLIQVALGDGLMNYPYIIKKIEEKCPNAYLILEGITGIDIKRSLNFIKNLL
ncbi:MAG: sugar phosphate isomerase/epimerase [Bacilli bacterium]|nr:sugar phosphate isomerase/epimerase [Bacilli bacterium]